MSERIGQHSDATPNVSFHVALEARSSHFCARQDRIDLRHHKIEVHRSPMPGVVALLR